jgi:putative DNA methylase
VALPLDAINAASAREKSIRHGHPSTLHLWWARRPLAACRAVLFASLVDDPSSYIEDEVDADRERQRLFRLIERLVPWEASQDEQVLAEARLEIARSLERNGAPAVGVNPTLRAVDAYVAKHAPPVLDPFCGGGSIPLEAQRLGLQAHGSDLNPVAVLITKALIEIPPRFAGQSPVNPEARKNPLQAGSWKGAKGLAADVRHYGQWMCEQAQDRIGHLYPRVKLPKDQGGGQATVIAWLWARTVICPNPACGCEMPLARSFALSTKKGNETWIEPVVKRGAPPHIEFRVASGSGKPTNPPKVGRGANFKCLACSQTVNEDYVKPQGVARRIGSKLMAVVAEGKRRRIYLAPTPEQEEAARLAVPVWGPEQEIARNPRWFAPPDYGMPLFRDIFTARQLVALTTLSDLLAEAMSRVRRDMATGSELPDDDIPLRDGGGGARAYAEAVGTYLAFALDRVIDRHSSIATWDSSPSKLQLRNTFARQAIPMSWDYGEGNPFCNSSGTWTASTRWVAQVLESSPCTVPGIVEQRDARTINTLRAICFATDPPYYDNIGYADLSDFFYVWLRRSIGTKVWPNLFATLLTPKEAELIASPYRHGGSRETARAFFETGLRDAFDAMRRIHDDRFPLSVFYAFKQTESDTDSHEENTNESSANAASSGWETMLESLLASGCTIQGTWPMRSELANRMVARGTNALASSIVLVCRKKDPDAPLCPRREFIAHLRGELPSALRKLRGANIAPVDLAQAAIGPGMTVFSRYSKVLEEDGSAMRVRTALVLINQVLDEVLAEHDGIYDADTRWGIAWFEQHGFDDGKYGDAETLARAKNTSVAGLDEAGIVRSKGGKVRLLGCKELNPNWTPENDKRLTVWEVTHYLLAALEEDGNNGAARLVRQVGELAEAAHDLAYRLYTVCEHNKWSQTALGYNALVVGWSDIYNATQREAASAEVLLFPESVRPGPINVRARRAPSATRSPASRAASKTKR